MLVLDAVALGASILERHITDTMDRKGPDIVCSMDPKNDDDDYRIFKILYLNKEVEEKFLLKNKK